MYEMDLCMNKQPDYCTAHYQTHFNSKPKRSYRVPEKIRGIAVGHGNILSLLLLE